MPAVTSAQWVISFGVESLVDSRTFTITLANTVSESDVKNLVRFLKGLEYVNVRYNLAVVLP